MNNKNIAEVKFYVTFNVKDFAEHQSEIFYVHGNPWVFRLKKTHSLQSNEDCLGFFLHSAIERETSDWAINASCSVKLLTSQFGQEPVRGYIGSAAYHQHNLKWGQSRFISWKNLIDLKNGYVQNGKCTVEIIVESSQCQNTTKPEHSKFERIQNCCDECSTGVFRLTVKNIDNLIGICTPEFTVNNFIWRISLGIYDKSKISGSQSNKALRLKLCNIATEDEQEWSCQTTIEWTLDSAYQPIQSQCDRPFNEYTHIQGLTLLKWNDLIDPNNKYLKNGSFSLQVKIKVSDVKGAKTKPKLKRPICNSLEFECSICFESLLDRSVSSISCGHIFCHACCSLLKVCPTCNQKLQAFKSGKMYHKVYLPLQS